MCEPCKNDCFAKDLEAANRLLSEARTLIQELLTWVGVDPTYQESVRMDDAQKRALAFLDTTLKRVSPPQKCDHGELCVIHKCADCGEEVKFV